VSGEPAAPAVAVEAPGPALVDLLLRPEAYFSREQPGWRVVTKLAVLVVLGLASGVGRGDTALPIPRGGEAATWTYYWGLVFATAALMGPVRWFLGGFWYRTRLRLCGAHHVDRAKAQRLFALSDLVHAIPTVAMALLMTLARPAPGWGDWKFSVLAALVFSLVVSYRGARAAFRLSLWKARAWFLVVPGLFYAIVLGRILWPR
jgi:hypothetical protein